MSIKSISVLVIWVFAAVIFTTCGKDNPTKGEPPEQTNPNTVSQDIGPAGGSITSKDGRVTLDFPEGALSSTETITITPIEEDNLGPEFDEVLNEFGFGKAYEMGPDGLSFEVPVTVTFHSEQVVKQEGDSVSISLELIFTNEEGGVVALDSLRMAVDEESGGVTVTGALNHFSKLVAFDNFDIVNVRVGFGVFYVPDYLFINHTFSTFVAVSAVRHTEPRVFFDFEDETYTDMSTPPLSRKFDPAEQVLEVDKNIKSGYFEYTCLETGIGVYKSKAKGYVIINNNNSTYSIFVEGLFNQKNVKCVPPPGLVNPANGATEVDLETTLKWKAVEGATSYTVQLVEEGKKFTDPEAVSVNTSAAVLNAQASGLKPNTTYKWRVRAWLSSYHVDKADVGEWSEEWTFTTKGSAEAKLDLLKQCVEHPDASWIANLFGFSIENNATKSKAIDFRKDDITEYTVTKSIELPDGTTEEVAASPNSEGQLLLDLEIYVYGNYAWEITDVTYQDESVPFSGDISGVIKVTSDEQNPGECTL